MTWLARETREIAEQYPHDTGHRNRAASRIRTSSNEPNAVRRSNASRVSRRWPRRSGGPAPRYRGIGRGRRNELRADASKKLKTVKAQDIMKRAGVLPFRFGQATPGATVLTAGVDPKWDERSRRAAGIAQ
jgi:hypothetical protein